MNPLARFLGMALFVVLAVLAALLAAPAWRQARSASIPAATAPALPAPGEPSPPARAAQLATFSQRVTLTVALVGLALAGALLFSMAMRQRSTESRPPYPTARHEMDTLAKLAESSVAQGAELSRERDVRRRAEEDAQLKQQLLAESVDEKIRLGRDLHDGIIQSLYAVGLTLESLRPLLKSDPDQAAARLDDIRTSLNAAIKDVRSYITGLTPENLLRASFSRAVTTLFDQLRAGRDVAFEITVDDAAAATLSVEQNVEALQIAREAISNALRHGQASQITLRMHQGDGEVCLLVHDNGRGFDAARNPSGGHGLGNMRARAERLGASLRVTSQPGQGARVIATFPSGRPEVV
jgi:signal transduction histidine kinase